MGLRSGKEHFTSHDWTYCVHSEDREGVFAMVDLMMAGKRDFWDVEYRNVCDDKAVRWVKSWGRCIRDSRGVPLRLTGMVADISEQKKFELERDRFVHTVVHDIKNPLTAIKLRSDLMRHTAVPPEKVMTFSKVIDSNVQRVLVILQEFVNAEWMRSRQNLKAEFEEFDLRELIENEVNSLSSSYGEKIQVEVSGDFHGLWSREGLRRAIQNLVDNAFRHGEPGAPVSIVSKRQGEDVLITVHNFGKPIPPEVQKVLFRPFENIEERDERGKRTLGFEFVLVRGVAEAHGGTVSVKSDETTGTTFELRLPIRSASQSETRILAS
jgi:signal transduction histidine kinase